MSDEKKIVGGGVTESMIKAGAEIIEGWAGVYPPDELAVLVFQAMLRAAPQERTSSQDEGQ